MEGQEENKSAVDKMDRFCELVGVKRVTGYNYIADRQSAPFYRAVVIDNLIGGGVSLWASSGSKKTKRVLFDVADI